MIEIKPFWEFNNSKHHEDQIDFFTIGTNEVFIVADGVSSNPGSRKASVIACKYAKEYLENALKDRDKGDNPSFLIQVVKETIEHIAKRMCNEAQHINESDWKNIIRESCKKFNEEEEFIDNYIKNIMNKNVSIEPSTTFALMIIDKEMSHLYTGILGDPVVIIIREGLTLCHYVSGGCDLKNYLSFKNGVSGSIDICSREIYKGDTIVMGSDGSKIFYKPDEGFPLALFKNIVKNENSENPAKAWLQALQEYDAIDDDFSLFIIKIY